MRDMATGHDTTSITISQPYTDEKFEHLRQMGKQIKNPGARWGERPKSHIGHRQRNFKAVAVDVPDFNFGVYMRQNTDVEEDFSCGIEYRPLAGSAIVLARYNGPSHWHRDADRVIDRRPHIHRASERAISMGKKPDWFAEETDRFDTVEGALACLMEDYFLTGISDIQHDHPRLDI